MKLTGQYSNPTFVTVILLTSALLLFSCNSAPASSGGKASQREIRGAISGNTASGSDTAGPDIEFENMNHDFGRVISGEDAKTAFTFVNKGSETLVIEKVKGG